MEELLLPFTNGQLIMELLWSLLVVRVAWLAKTRADELGFFDYLLCWGGILSGGGMAIWTLVILIFK